MTLVKRRFSSAGALCARSGPPHGRAISAEYTRKSVYGCHLRPWSVVPPVKHTAYPYSLVRTCEEQQDEQLDPP